MTDVSLATLDGGTRPIHITTLDAFRHDLQGEVLDENAPLYDEARAVWNGMIDRRPGLIVRCRNAGDVGHAVRFARDNGLLVAIRGGGHHIAGNAVCEGGVVIDLSQMKSVRVDAAAKRAWVEPGATLADVDSETQAFGLAVPTGVNSSTGIAGLTLGGGFGWLTRKFGLTIDSLVAADVVTADGRSLRASAAENPDLFWALRGGGGNFGVVTGFEFALHPVGPEVLAGFVVHALDDAEALLPRYRALVEAASDELTCWAILRKAPPLPFLPAEWHGRGVLVLAMCYVGDLAEGEKAVAGLRALGRPIAEAVGPNAFVDWQQVLDPLLTPGARNYWKSHDFAELDEAAGAVLADAARSVPDPECEILIFHIGGAASRVPVADTAFPQRNAHFGMNVHARWADPGKDKACVDWAKATFAAAAPFAAGTAYVNFMPGDEGERVESAYGANYCRLAEMKQRYDPANLFRLNQNVRPIP